MELNIFPIKCIYYLCEKEIIINNKLYIIFISNKMIYLIFRLKLWYDTVFDGHFNLRGSLWRITDPIVLQKNWVYIDHIDLDSKPPHSRRWRPGPCNFQAWKCSLQSYSHTGRPINRDEDGNGNEGFRRPAVDCLTPLTPVQFL